MLKSGDIINYYGGRYEVLVNNSEMMVLYCHRLEKAYRLRKTSNEVSNG